MNDRFPLAEHEELLTFLSRALGNAQSRWWWYDYGQSKPICALCGRPISAEMVGLIPAVYRLVLEHKEKHVKLLGRDKVRAAEALFLLRKSGDWRSLVEDIWGGIPVTTVPEGP